MSQKGKSPNPNKRMGVFKELEGVPERYRFHQYSGSYSGEDTYGQYLEQKLLPQYPDASDKYHRSIHRAGERWKAHMAERGRHHALATPKDVEEWVGDLLGDLTVGTAYSQYWVRIHGFYSWLQTHTDHPHSYHPVLMAAANYPDSLEVWNYKLGKGNGNSKRWEK
jgi:hypothetical protein